MLQDRSHFSFQFRSPIPLSRVSYNTYHNSIGELYQSSLHPTAPIYSKAEDVPTPRIFVTRRVVSLDSYPPRESFSGDAVRSPASEVQRRLAQGPTKLRVAPVALFVSLRAVVVVVAVL